MRQQKNLFLIRYPSLTLAFHGPNDTFLKVLQGDLLFLEISAPKTKPIISNSFGSDWLKQGR